MAIFKSLLDKYKNKDHHKGRPTSSTIVVDQELKIEESRPRIETPQSYKPSVEKRLNLEIAIINEDAKEKVEDSLENHNIEKMEEELKQAEPTIIRLGDERIQEFDRKVDGLSLFKENEKELIVGLERETTDRAQQLRDKEEDKIKTLVNILIDLQLNKLESKLQYLEEYEKLVWYEKTQLEVYQKMHIAERVSLASKRKELARLIDRENQKNLALEAEENARKNIEMEKEEQVEQGGEEGMVLESLGEDNNNNINNNINNKNGLSEPVIENGNGESENNNTNHQVQENQEEGSLQNPKNDDEN